MTSNETPAIVRAVLATAAMVVGVLLAAAQTGSEVSVGSPSGQTPRNRMRIPSGSCAA
jgi:hypothetical protein